MATRPGATVQPPLQWSLTSLALFALVYLGASLPLPTRAIALVPTVVVAVITVRELLRQRREDAPVRMRLMPTITLVLVGFVFLTAVAQVVLYDGIKQYQDCLSGASTSQARAQCEVQRQQSGFGTVIGG